MIGGIFSKGSSGHSVKTIGQSRSGHKTIGSHSSGYVKGIGHSLPHGGSGYKLNSNLEAKINDLQQKFGRTSGSYQQ